MDTTLLQVNAAGIEIAANCLRAGGVVGMPTETVYGLAAVVNDPSAVLRVFAVKERPLFDPLIVHLPTAEWVARHADLGRLTVRARDTLDRLVTLWPAPLTIVLPRDPSIPDLVTSGLDTVALRVPDHPAARALIAAVGCGLAAPSANRFGRISPTSAGAVLAELGGRIPYVLDGGSCAVGLESTVVQVRPDGALDLLRPGGVTREALGAIARVEIGGSSPASPGQLPSHYAPRTPVILRDRAGDPWPSGSLAVLSVDGVVEVPPNVVAVRVLSARRDPVEASRALFATLRELDALGVELIVAEQWPDDAGLGFAIRDRLRRAAARPEG